MKFKIEKNLRIVNELVTYYHKNNCDDIHIDMSTVNNVSYFCILGNVPNLCEKDFELLKDVLNAPRQHEVEQYYWNLGGNTELDCELSLVGAMIDTAEVTYIDNILTIKIKRGCEIKP